jgi:hypothetical protein
MARSTNRVDATPKKIKMQPPAPKRAAGRPPIEHGEGADGAAQIRSSCFG